MVICGLVRFDYGEVGSCSYFPLWQASARFGKFRHGWVRSGLAWSVSGRLRSGREFIFMLGCVG